MGNILLNDALDQKLVDMQEQFRGIFEQTLGGMLGRPVAVTSRGPEEFQFKELKAAMPGEVVATTLTATEGGPGKIVLVMSREAGAQVADLLLMGDGKASFNHEEHVEPIRDLIREAVASFASALGTQLERRIAFDEVKSSVVDLTPPDFFGTGWVITPLDIATDPAQEMFVIMSMDFCEACFPDTPGATEEGEAETVDDHDSADVYKDMGIVMDIALPVAIELGRTSMLIRDIVNLAPGSIVELDKLSGEPVDVYVNGRAFAKGEVVVVDEYFAVRLTEMIAPTHSIQGRRN